MKVFYESKLAKWLLWQGYSTITLGCFVFTKKSKEEMKQSTLNHEAIHVRQWEECMIASAVLLTVIMLFTGFNLWVYPNEDFAAAFRRLPPRHRSCHQSGKEDANRTN